ncbi:ABC-three component system middle component 1 [Cytobacillus pseudoceanisediminis]
MNKSELLEVLDRQKFIVKNTEMFQKNYKEFVYCYNYEKKISLIVKEYEQFSQSSIVEDVMQVRMLLRANEINIWNSYYIILAPRLSEQAEKKIYSIERNPKGLRKYVITNERDLYRIPFIKLEQSSGILLNFESSFNDILSSNDQDVIKFLEWIMESQGDTIEIKKSIIKDKITKSFVRTGLDEIR